MEELMIEELAGLMHIHWVQSTKKTLDNLSEYNIARWKRQIATAYQDLNDDEKRFNRDWAHKIINIIKSKKDYSINVVDNRKGNSFVFQRFLRFITNPFTYIFTGRWRI